MSTSHKAVFLGQKGYDTEMKGSTLNHYENTLKLGVLPYVKRDFDKHGRDGVIFNITNLSSLLPVKDKSAVFAALEEALETSTKMSAEKMLACATKHSNRFKMLAEVDDRKYNYVSAENKAAVKNAINSGEYDHVKTAVTNIQKVLREFKAKPVPQQATAPLSPSEQNIDDVPEVVEVEEDYDKPDNGSSSKSKADVKKKAKSVTFSKEDQKVDVKGKSVVREYTQPFETPDVTMEYHEGHLANEDLKAGLTPKKNTFQLCILRGSVKDVDLYSSTQPGKKHQNADQNT
ncbi:hypothetical protein HDU93_001090 [Gonapodya sp. JEL0774]|nr:hypothetical protein HDU93_001090 [Gonapodya sp. JEL0774]